MPLPRILSVVVFLVAVQAVVSWIQRGYTMEEIASPLRSPSDLPHQIGPWKGEDVKADEKLIGRLEAEAEVDRLYRNADGSAISLHYLWSKDYVRVHFPQQCYHEAGWEKVSEKTVSIPIAKDQEIPARIITFDREGEKIQVLYWLQLGDQFFFDRGAHHVLRQRLCWGVKKWPPLTKLMLQTSATNPEAAQARLIDLARAVYQWAGS